MKQASKLRFLNNKRQRHVQNAPQSAKFPVGLCTQKMTGQTVDRCSWPISYRKNNKNIPTTIIFSTIERIVVTIGISIASTLCDSLSKNYTFNCAKLLTGLTVSDKTFATWFVRSSQRIPLHYKASTWKIWSVSHLKQKIQHVQRNLIAMNIQQHKKFNCVRLKRGR